MRSKLLLSALLVLPLLTAAPRPASADDAAPKKRVAVLDFEFGTVSKWWNGDWNVGKGISDLVVTNLVKDGTYSVIERRRLAEVLGEQNLAQGGRIDQKTAAQLGKVLGAQTLIVGSVTQFGFDDKSIKVGGAGGIVGGAFGGLGVGKKKSKAIVVVDARMIDTTTGEILAVASGKGESRRESFSGFGAGGGGRGGGFGAAGIDMSSSNFQQTIIGEATRKCVEELSAGLIKSESKVAAAAPSAA